MVEKKFDPLLSIITAETCHQPVKTHSQPTTFQSRIRERIFKPLRLSSTLHPYPPNFFKYLPLFTGEDHVTAEKHLEYFHNFIDNFEIVDEDIVMRIFSKSLARDVGIRFRNLKSNSIGSWGDLHDVFFKYWGKTKSYDQFLSELYGLKRDNDEPSINLIGYFKAMSV